MKYTIRRITPDSVYNDDVFTYSCSISDDKNSFFVVLSSTELEKLELKENKQYSKIKCTGLAFNVCIDTDSNTITSDYGKDLSVELTAEMIIKDNEYYLNINDENLEIELIELVRPKIIGNKQVISNTKFKLSAKLIRLDICSVEI